MLPWFGWPMLLLCMFIGLIMGLSTANEEDVSAVGHVLFAAGGIALMTFAYYFGTHIFPEVEWRHAERRLIRDITGCPKSVVNDAVDRVIRAAEDLSDVSGSDAARLLRQEVLRNNDIEAAVRNVLAILKTAPR